jgi:hypothetical protein
MWNLELKRAIIRHDYKRRTVCGAVSRERGQGDSRER